MLTNNFWLSMKTLSLFLKTLQNQISSSFFSFCWYSHLFNTPIIPKKVVHFFCSKFGWYLCEEEDVCYDLFPSSLFITSSFLLNLDIPWISYFLLVTSRHSPLSMVFSLPFYVFYYEFKKLQTLMLKRGWNMSYVLWIKT